MKRRFNIIDILALLFLIGAIAAGVWFFTTVDAGETVSVYFVVELIQRDDGFAELVTAGDEIRDAIRNHLLGHVVSVEAVPATIVSFNATAQTFNIEPVPDRYDVSITIRGIGTETASNIRTHGQEVRVGQETFIRGRGYAGGGFITRLWTEE